MLRKICSGIISGNTDLPDPCTITNFNVRPYPNAALVVDQVKHASLTVQLKDNHSRVLGQITSKHLEAFEDFIVQSGKTPNTYKMIKMDAEWKDIYEYAIRPVNYMIGGVASQKQEETAPCSECGIILHEKLVSVDHQRAQANDPVDAIYKVFKAVGYTEQGQVGQKAQKMYAQWSRTLGGSAQTGNGQRTLNSIGVIVFSLLWECGYDDNLKELCMHNFINLRPVCVFCNSSLRNKL